MDQEQQRTAKLRLIMGMREGRPWRDAAGAADLQTSRTAAYRLLQRVNAEGEQALVDGRHGHPSKLREPVRAWLGDDCRGAPGPPSRVVQTALRERFGVTVSIGHLNRVRVALGLRDHHGSVGEKSGPG